MLIGIIGTGRLGLTLAHAWQEAGREIVSYTATNARHQAVKNRIGGKPQSLPQVLAAADTIVLSVPETALPELAQEIVQAAFAQDTDLKGHTFIHTSGATPLNVLDPLRQAGAATASLHPAMTVTGEPADLLRLQGCPVAVAASPPAVLPRVRSLVADLGAVAFAVPEGSRAAYHAALAHAANHVVTVIVQARSMLAAANLPEEPDVLARLVHAAVDNALAEGVDALTGPVMRGDAATVTKHLQVLRKQAEAGETAQETMRTYQALARATAGQAQEAGFITAEQAAVIKRAL